MPGKETVSGIGDSFRFFTDGGVLAKECSPGSRTDRSLEAGGETPRIWPDYRWRKQATVWPEDTSTRSGSSAEHRSMT